MTKLVVVIPFAKYQAGDEITTQTEVKEFLLTHRNFVVPVAADAEPVAEVAEAEDKATKKKDR